MQREQGEVFPPALCLMATSFVVADWEVVVFFVSVFQDEDIDRTLDQAIELARSMKRTTDRMAQRLSADLAKAQHRRKQHSLQPPGGRKHHSL